jgi:hypothetical protein
MGCFALWSSSIDFRYSDWLTPPDAFAPGDLLQPIQAHELCQLSIAAHEPKELVI